MLRGLWSAASGMSAQKMNIDVIANNLANVNTTGFKKSRTDFQDLMYQTISQAGSRNTSGDQIPAGIQIGMGTMPVGVQKMFLQGDFQETKNDFLGKVRKINFCSTEELSIEQMQDVLTKLESLPDKIETFFRRSVRNAINQCNDTKRLKELLALI